MGESISLFVAGSKSAIKETLKLIAAKGKIQLQAQSDEIEITAEKRIALTSTQAAQLWAGGKNILLTCGGAYIKIGNGNIQLHAPGDLVFRAANHDWGGPDRLSMPPTVLPQPPERLAYSQKLDWEGVSAAWLPMSETRRTLVQKASRPLALLSSGPAQPETRAALSNTADEVRYLASMRMEWEVEEFIDLPETASEDEHE